MNLIVCVKSTPVSDAVLKVLPQKPYIDRLNLKYDLNPYDEYAIEAAVQLKEQTGGSVIAISVSDDATSSSLKRVLAMGADKLIELRLPYVGLNEPLTIARLLAAEIRTLPFDLILLGKQAIDTGNGATGALLASLLNLPYIAAVTNLSVTNGKLEATRELEDCRLTLECVLPAVITTEKGLNKPRYPSLRDIMAAKKKEIVVKVVTPEEENLDIAQLQPPAPRAVGKILTDPTVAVPELVSFLKNQGI